jgi:ATP-dependent Zn protease
MDEIFLNAQFRHKIVIQKNDTTNWTMQTHEVVDLDIKKSFEESCAWMKRLIVDNQTILDRMASELLQSDTLSKGRD